MIEAGEPLGTRYVVVKTVTEPPPRRALRSRRPRRDAVPRAAPQRDGRRPRARGRGAAGGRGAPRAPVGAQGPRRGVDLSRAPGGPPRAPRRHHARVGSPRRDRRGARQARGDGVALPSDRRDRQRPRADPPGRGHARRHQRAACCVCAAPSATAGNLQLSGFGIDAFARGNNPENAPSKRADLVALLNALQELFSVGGLSPEGGAAAKWLLLRTSAQHGEHPALASGASLSTALNEMAALRPDDGPPRVVRAPTLAPPTRSTAGSAAVERPFGLAQTRRGRAQDRSSRSPRRRGQRVDQAACGRGLEPPASPEGAPRRGRPGGAAHHRGRGRGRRVVRAPRGQRCERRAPAGAHASPLGRARRDLPGRDPGAPRRGRGLSSARGVRHGVPRGARPHRVAGAQAQLGRAPRPAPRSAEATPARPA